MNTKLKYIVVIVAIVAVLGAFWFLQNKNNSTPNQPAENVNTDTSKTRYMDIESYIKNNITNISPIKEQLGGTFYVTSIQTNNGTGSVSYEDGHNAYNASFTYLIDKDGKPTITRFEILEI